MRYRQVVVLAARRSRRERDQLRDDDIVARRAQFANIRGNYERLAPLGDINTPLYEGPESGAAGWNTAAFRSMRSRTCFRDHRPIAKQRESSFPSQPPSRDGH